MKITKQKNPYLKRYIPNIPHKYFFDLNKGQYLLLSQDGNQQQINKNGSFKPIFKNKFTGFINHHQRYQEANNNPSVLHFMPDLKYIANKNFHTPKTDKFAGYAQFPYQLKQSLPQHLKDSKQKPTFLGWKSYSQLKNKQKTNTLKKQVLQQHRTNSLILEHTLNNLSMTSQKTYFDTSFNSMTKSKPLPRYRKKTCYNYKCKHLKNFVFDEKSKIETINKHLAKTNSTSNTLGKSFYDQTIHLENQEIKLINKFH